MKKLISVTQEDIRLGTRKDQHTCPIALAVQRVLPEFANIEVSNDEISIGAPKFYSFYSHELPISAIDFIRAFDNERPVEPFSFYLEDFPV